VSFGTPLVLIGLVLVPVAIVLYVRAQRDRRRAQAAFVAPALTPSVAPRRPGWRRHAPLIALLAAIAVLVGAAAKPQRTVAVPVERASIMLVTDVSSSMRATDVSPSRLVAAKKAAKQFVDSLPSGVSVGLIAYNQAPSLLQSPTRDRAAIASAIERMSPSGNTATGDAITMATGLLTAQTTGLPGEKPAPAAIVVLSDGKSTSGVDPVEAAQAAKKKNISVSTVALGTANGTVTYTTPGGRTVTTKVPPDPESLAEVARVSGGQAFTAASSTKLDAVYQRLGSQLGHEEKNKELTAGFAGGAIALLLLGGLLSVRWFGRLI
jgi:Ca-activated chloride channel homolog